MPDALIHDDETPEGRSATDSEIAALLGGMTAADGTSYLDISNDASDQQ
ncbi:hypothetical protein [Streptomyces sp. NPDC059994]